MVQLPTFIGCHNQGRTYIEVSGGPGPLSKFEIPVRFASDFWKICLYSVSFYIIRPTQIDCPQSRYSLGPPLATMPFIFLGAFGWFLQAVQAGVWALPMPLVAYKISPYFTFLLLYCHLFMKHGHLVRSTIFCNQHTTHPICFTTRGSH